MKDLRPAANLDEVIAWVKAHEYIYYQAPLDHAPCAVDILRYTISNVKPESSRMTICTHATGCLTWYLAQHLDRFRIPV